jgi:hypothetical protein
VDFIVDNCLILQQYFEETIKQIEQKVFERKYLCAKGPLI